ncbi:hypothetical protein AMTR_s01762p00006000, partial [Amborella trichopoda]
MRAFLLTNNQSRTYVLGQAGESHTSLAMAGKITWPKLLIERCSTKKNPDLTVFYTILSLT